MVGADAVFTLSNYSNPAQAPGLYNSNGPGGSIFYSQRLSRTVHRRDVPVSKKSC
jgi:hypothetical protein